MKKVFFFAVLALIGFAPHVLAQGFTALAPIPGLTDTGSTAVVNSATLANFFNNLYKYLIGLAATIAVIQIIWAGLDIAFWHKDAVSALQEDKGKIYNAIFGLILVLSPVLVFSIINPSILNLSLNLPKLDTKSATQTTTGGTGNTAAAEAAKCSTARISLGATDTTAVGCSTQEDAQNFAASCSNGQGKVFATGDTSAPYGASCLALQPFQGHRDYTDKAQIPSSYWCYLMNVISGNIKTLTYVCGADKNSCDALVLSGAGSTYAGGCRTAPF